MKRISFLLMWYIEFQLSYEQLTWLIPDSSHDLLWDYGMCVDSRLGAAVRDLISKALKGPLAPSQQEVIYLVILQIASYLYFNKKMNIRVVSLIAASCVGAQQ